MTMIVAPACQQPVEHAGQGGHVERVQAGGRLVEDVQRAALAAAQPGGDPQPLRLAAGQGRRGLAEPQVTQSDLADRPQRRGDRGPVGEPLQGVVHAQAEHVGDGQAVDPDGQGGVVEAGAVAGRALDGDVGQVLDVEVDVAEPAAGRALALAGVEREVPGLPAPPPGVRGLGEHAADLVERPGVGRGRRPRVLADRRGVDLDDLADAAEVQAADVPGQRATRSARARAAGMRLSRTRAVFPAPDGPASAVSRCTGKAAVRSCRLYRSPISMVICPPGPARCRTVPGHGRGPGQERADDRVRVGFQLAGGALGDHRAALGAGRRGRAR